MLNCDNSCSCKSKFAINPEYSKFLDNCLLKPISFSDYSLVDKMASGRLLITFNRHCQLWASTGDNLPPCHAIMHVTLQNPGKFFKVADLTKDFPHLFKNDIPTFIQHMNGHGIVEIGGYLLPVVPAMVPKHIHMLLVSILYPILPSNLNGHVIEEGCPEVTVEDYFNLINREYPTLYPIVNNQISKRNANQVITSLNRIRDCIALVLYNPRTTVYTDEEEDYDVCYSIHSTYENCNVNFYMMDETLKFFDAREFEYSHRIATRMNFELRVKWFNLLALLNPSIHSPIQNSPVCLFCGSLRSGPDPKGLTCDHYLRIQEEIIGTPELSPRVRPVLVGKVNDGIGHWSGVTHLEFDKNDSCHVGLNIIDPRYFSAIMTETFIHPRELHRMDGIEDPMRTRDDVRAVNSLLVGMRACQNQMHDYIPDGEF